MNHHVVGHPFPGYNATAQKLGQSAYRAGWALEMCPYQPNIPLIAGERSSWRYGWLQENAAAKMSAPDKLSPARGILLSLAISSVFWFCMGVFVSFLLNLKG